MKSYSLVFLAMWLQDAQSPDVVCDRFGAIANSGAAVIQDVLNNRLGGVVPLEGALSLVYESFEIAFEEPSFIGCEATIGTDIKVNGVVLQDQEGTATVKGTFDIAALLERQVCITGLEVTELDIDNLPDPLMDIISVAILGNLEVPEICVPLPGGEA